MVEARKNSLANFEEDYNVAPGETSRPSNTPVDLPEDVVAANE